MWVIDDDLFCPHIPWAGIPGGRGGGGGGTRPPTILKVGDTISNVPPPPHVFVVGRFFVGKIGFVTKFV